MGRVELKFPEPAVFNDQIVLRTTDMSRAGHLGFDTQVSLVHHVMTRFLDHCGLPASGGGGISHIVKDLAVIYQGEAHSGDRLLIEVGVGERGDRWVELYFRLLRGSGQRGGGQPAADLPAAGQQVAGQPVAGQPVAGQLVAGQLVALAKIAILCFDYDNGTAVAFPPKVRRALGDGNR